MSDGRQRPTAVLVLGILNIVWGVLGICGGMFGLLGQFSPAGAKPQIPAELQIGMNILQGIGLMLSISLIASGIGLILMKNWGRLLTIIYAIVAIPVSLANTALTAKVIRPLMEQTGGQIPPELEGVVIAVAIGVGLCCGLIYPIVLLVVLNLKTVREAFTGASSQPPPVGPQ